MEYRKPDWKEIILLKPFLILALLLSFHSAFAIGNGHLARRSDFEYQSSVIIRWKDGGYCSGTLVARDLILTAGHCLTNWRTKVIDGVPQATKVGPTRPSDIVVHFGNNLSTVWDTSSEAEIDAVSQYPGYYEDMTKPDLELIHLKCPAPSDYTPATVLDDSSLLKTHMEIIIAGFGRTGVDRNFTSVLLRWFVSRLYSTTNERDQLRLYKPEELPWTRFRARMGDLEEKTRILGGGERGGDSGGGAFATILGKTYLVGVASGYDDFGYPTYGNIALARSWLIGAAQKLGSQLP